MWYLGHTEYFPVAFLYLEHLEISKQKEKSTVETPT